MKTQFQNENTNSKQIVLRFISKVLPLSKESSTFTTYLKVIPCGHHMLKEQYN